MIYDTLDHAARYRGLSPFLDRALEFLAGADFSALEDGKIVLDGDNVFAFLSTYVPSAAGDTPEAHRRYIDVQYLVSGKEQVGVCPLRDVTELTEEHPDRDLWLYRASCERLAIGGGRFLVLWPEDAHAPGIPLADGQVRKCVVKVRV